MEIEKEVSTVMDEVVKSYKTYLNNCDNQSGVEKVCELIYYWMLFGNSTKYEKLYLDVTKRLKKCNNHIFECLDSFSSIVWGHYLDDACTLFIEQPGRAIEQFKKLLKAGIVYEGLVEFGHLSGILNDEEGYDELKQIQGKVNEIINYDNNLYDKHIRQELNKNGEQYTETAEINKKRRLVSMFSVLLDYVQLFSQKNNPFWGNIADVLGNNRECNRRDYDKFMEILGIGFNGEEYELKKGKTFGTVENNVKYLERYGNNGFTYLSRLKRLELRSMFGYYVTDLLCDGYKERFVCIPSQYQSFRILDCYGYYKMKDYYGNKLGYVTSIETMPLDYLEDENLAIGYVANWVNRILRGMEENHYLLPLLRM